MTVDRERGAVVHHVQAGSACRARRAETGAPLSGSAAQEGYGLGNRDDSVAVRGWVPHKGSSALDVTSQPAQSPARSGAGGSGGFIPRRPEPEALESALGTVEGAR